MYVHEGHSIRSITQFLNDSNVPVRSDLDTTKYRKRDTGKPITWNMSKIKRVLIGADYLGVHVWGKRYKTLTETGADTHKANPPEKWIWSDSISIMRNEENFWDSSFEVLQYDYPAIIDIDTYIKAQKKLIANAEFLKVNKPAHASERTQYALTGLLLCGHCGRSLNGRKDSDNHNNRYYYCHTAKVSKQHCMSQNVRCDHVENYVFSTLSNAYVLNRLINAVAEENRRKIDVQTKYHSRINHYNSEIARLTGEKEYLFSVIKEKKTRHADMFLSQIDDIQDEIFKYERALVKVKHEMEQEENAFINVDDFVLNLNNPDLIYGNLPVWEKKHFFKKYIDRVEYYNKDDIRVYLKFHKEPFTGKDMDEKLNKEETKTEENESDFLNGVDCRFGNEPTRVHRRCEYKIRREAIGGACPSYCNVAFLQRLTQNLKNVSGKLRQFIQK